MTDAWKAVSGVKFTDDGSEGQAGVIWIASSIDSNQKCSYPRTAHYENVKERKNYVLLTSTKAQRILISTMDRNPTAQGVLVKSVETGETRSIAARNEVIVAAGTIHSPQVLQWSGIGPKRRLEEADIEVIHELPGFGMSFVDHTHFDPAFQCTKTQKCIIVMNTDSSSSKQRHPKSKHVNTRWKVLCLVSLQCPQVLVLSLIRDIFKELQLRLVANNSPEERTRKLYWFVCRAIGLWSANKTGESPD